MAINLKPVDVAVIGLGAAGGVAVLPLARAGLKVAGIEAGDLDGPAQLQTGRDPQQRAPAGDVGAEGAAGSPHRSQRASDAHAPPGTVHPMMNAIGGTSIHYWAQSWRLKLWDFKTRSETVKRYGVSAHSGGLDARRLADRLRRSGAFLRHRRVRDRGIRESGKHPGPFDPAGNIYEGPRQREYPMPPLRGSGFSDHMAEAARNWAGIPFAPPAAINSQPYQGRPGCAYHGYCGTGGCHISAKNSTAVTTIPAARKTKNLTDFR